jgi:hypothetical protein
MTNIELAIKSVVISHRAGNQAKLTNLIEKTNCVGPLLAELRSSAHAFRRLLWRNFLVIEGKILKLRNLLQPWAINPPKQTLKTPTPAAIYDPL